MTINEIADAVMRDWSMGFGGIELDFALEVANRAMRAERESCAKVCESLFDMNDDSCDEAGKCASAIRARSN